MLLPRILTFQTHWAWHISQYFHTCNFSRYFLFCIFLSSVFSIPICVCVCACEQALIVQHYYTETRRHHHHQLIIIIIGSSRSALTWPVTIADRTVLVTRISTDAEHWGLHKRLPLRTGNVLSFELSSWYLQLWIVTAIRVVWVYWASWMGLGDWLIE